MAVGLALAVERGLSATCEAVGRAVAWLALALMAVTCLVVALRYGFAIGSIPLQESATYLHGTLFMLGLAATLRRGGHVRVDVLYGRFAPRTRVAIDLAGTLLFLLPVTLFLGITSLDYVAAAWRIREGSPEVGGLPFIWLLKTLIPAALLLLVLQAVADVLRAVLQLGGRLPLPDAGTGAPDDHAGVV